MERTLEQCQTEVNKEQSYARLTITPIKSGDREYYRFDEEVHIRPYPNAYGYGGQWGVGRIESEEELEKLIASFKHYLREWQERGLENIEIIHKPKMTVVEYKNKRLKELVDKERAEAGFTQLTLM